MINNTCEDLPANDGKEEGERPNSERERERYIASLFYF
jgi:hypothetical protein